MATTRVTVLHIPVDNSGPQIIQLPVGSGPFREIDIAEQSGSHSWALTAPLSGSPSKVFAPGEHKKFANGPYQPTDIIGYGLLDSGSSFLELLCEI